jgi:signal transduction histidine kinase
VPPRPPAVDVSAYRIVQEALTNTMKHAGRCQVTVRMRYAPDAVGLEVCDDGAEPRGAAGPPGRGLAGMRERVGILGGAFEAGPLPGGRGFRVSARLPVEPGA